MRTADILLFLAAVLLYFLPTLIAEGRDSYNKRTVFALNFVLGWTGIVWLICLFWAFDTKLHERKTLAGVSDERRREIEEEEIIRTEARRKAEGNI